MIRGEKRPITKTDVDIQAAIHNRFDIEVRDAKTGELKQRAQAFNVICDALWTRMFNGNSYFNYILYGEGTGTPSSSDTALFTRIDGLSAGSAASTINNTSGIYSLRKQATIDETTSVGKTITEIGIGYDATHIVTHAMLQDMNGNPISITKTNTDIITFYATVYVHWNPNGYSNGKILFMSTASSWILPCFAGNSGLNGVSIYPSYSTCYGVVGIYKNASFTKTLATKTFSFSGLRFAVGEANTTIYGFALQDAIYISSDAAYSSSMNIVGESIGTGDGTTVVFDTKFPIRSNCKVYVDGVEQSSGLTIQPKVIPATISQISGRNEVSRRFKLIDSSKVITARSTIGVDEGGPVYIENTDEEYFSGIILWTNNLTSTLKIYGSTDFENWTQFWSDSYYGSSAVTGPYVSNFNAPVNYKYIKLVATSHGVSSMRFVSSRDYSITFSTPPAAGSVITADYVPDCIPKDGDHVFDFGLTITLGEYSGV